MRILERRAYMTGFWESAESLSGPVEAAGKRCSSRGLGRWIDVPPIHADGWRPNEASPLRLVEFGDFDEHDAGRDID
jgi:hypothetical protein